MTTDEKKLQRANLIIELEDTGNDFAHEREAVLRCADTLQELSMWLQGHANREPSSDDLTAGGDLEDATIRTQGKYRECLDFNRLLQLTGNLKKHRQKLYSLKLRKSNLGV